MKKIYYAIISLVGVTSSLTQSSTNLLFKSSTTGISKTEIAGSLIYVSEAQTKSEVNCFNIDSFSSFIYTVAIQDGKEHQPNWGLV